MRITPVFNAVAAPVAAPPSAPLASPVESLTPAAPPSTPAMDLYYRINRDILRIPGVRSMFLYGAERPNELGINAADERAAAAIAGILEPVVDGVALKVYVQGNSREPYAGPAGKVLDQISLIDALTGVWNHKASFLRRGNGTVTFHTTGQDVIDRLNPILRDRWNRGVDKNGWTVWVNVRWKAGVPPPA